MFFKEPKIEFVQLTMTMITDNSTCSEEVSVDGSSSGYCTGPTGPTHEQDCSGGNTMYKIQDSRTSTKKSKPENVVGFDMTFNK